MAPKAKRVEKRRAARLRNKAKHELVEDELDVVEDEIEEEPVTKEIAEKDYGMDSYSMPMNGPTSWEEHEAMKVAQEQAKIVREVTWTTQDLVSNILYADMSPEQKSSAIKAVGDGMGKKLKEAEKHEKMEKELDLELLEIEAIISKDSRHLSLVEKASDWISKAKLTATAENKLSDDQFALVVERDGKKVRKYPIHDKAHVRNALARAAQMIKEGGEAAADAKAALPKIKAAAKKMGIGMEKSSIMIEKDKSGNWRAVLWPTNNFIDRDEEIISEKAHLEYVDWVNKNMDCAPELVTWHIPGTAREHSIDFVGYESGHVVMSGILTEKEASELLKAQSMTDVGLSHGSIVLERDPEDERVVTKYRMVEVSDLPLENAANPFTSLQTVTIKEADMNVKEYLVGMLGPEKAEQYLTKMESAQKVLKEAKVESKEKAAEAPTTPEASPLPASANVEAIAAQVFERISKELDVDGLNDYLVQLKENAEKVPVLESLVKELVKGNEDKLAEMIEPPAAKTLVWQKARSSQNKATVLNENNEEDKRLQKSKPELGWLSEATGTVPVEA